MKKNVVPILLAILIVMQAVSFSKINRLQVEVENANRQISQVSSGQSGAMSNIYSNIDTLLKRQSSIIDTYDYSFGDADRETLTIPMTVSVIPKETKTGTMATLHLAGESATMERKGTTFEATLPLGLFEVLDARVVFAEEGTERSEKLDIWENLREKYVPSLYAHFEGESGYQLTTGKTTGEYIRKGNLNLESKAATYAEFREVRLVLEVDGAAVSDREIGNVLGQRISVDEKVTLSPGQTLTMRVVARDSLGLVHRLTIDEVTIDENAQPVFGEFFGMGGEAIITDQNGKILYDPQNGEFR